MSDPSPVWLVQAAANPYIQQAFYVALDAVGRPCWTDILSTAERFPSKGAAQAIVDHGGEAAVGGCGGGEPAIAVDGGEVAIAIGGGTAEREAHHEQANRSESNGGEHQRRILRWRRHYFTSIPRFWELPR